MSEPLKAVTVGSWATKDAIPITGHSYEDFKEFLTFLYLGQCQIHNYNVMALVDLAESYDVSPLTNKCDIFLTKTKPSAENVLNIYESLKLYSLKNACTIISEFIKTNTSEVLLSAQFLNAKRETIMDIVQMENLSASEEDLFEAVSFYIHECFWER